MLILKDLTCECQLFSRHIGHSDLDRAPELAEAEEKSGEKAQEKNEDNAELKLLFLIERPLIHRYGFRILLHRHSGVNFLCLLRAEDARRIRIKGGDGGRLIAVQQLLRMGDIRRKGAAVRPLCGILRHHACHECLNDRRNAGHEAAERLRLLLKMLARNAHRRIAVKGNMP